MKKAIGILMALLVTLSSFGCQKVADPNENKEKLLLKKIIYYDSGQIVDRRIYTYDEIGNFTSISTYNGITTLYEYEEDRVIRASEMDRVSTYSYDENKNLSEVIKTDDGEPIGSIKYEYDSFNNLIKMITETDGEKTEAAYTYNKDNQVIEAISSQNNQEHRTEFEYDKDGNCIKETQYTDDVATTVVTSVYENDLLISQKHDNQAEQSFVDIKFVYNEDSQVINELVSYDGDQFFKRIEYIYE